MATAGTSGALVKGSGTGLTELSYGEIESIEDAVSDEGLVLVRLEFEDIPVLDRHGIPGNLKLRKSKLSRLKSYFQDQIHVLFLQEASPKTRITLGRREKFSFTLEEMLERKEIHDSADDTGLRVNFLLDREIGEINLSAVGIDEPGDEFSFVAMADPQGGDPDHGKGLKTRMKIHNAFIQESVELVNRLPFDPLFTVVIGDVCDDWGHKKDLVQMNDFLSELKCPVLYGIGNHETMLRSEFAPGYNMEA
jgi:hypothetical protein